MLARLPTHLAAWDIVRTSLVIADTTRSIRAGKRCLAPSRPNYVTDDFQRQLIEHEPIVSASHSNQPAQRVMTALLALTRNPSLRIMLQLVAAPRRYNELLDALPECTEPAVGAYLRELDSDGLAQRRVDPGPPLRVLYELTPLGLEIAPSLGAIESWASRTDQA